MYQTRTECRFTQHTNNYLYIIKPRFRVCITRRLGEGRARIAATRR